MSEAVDKQFIVWRNRAEAAEAQRDALVKALRLAERIVADRASGGRMLTNKEDAEAALVLCHEALALVGGSKQP